jgi:amicyanin
MPPMMRGPYMAPYANRPAMPGYQQPMPPGIQQQAVAPTESAQSAEPLEDGTVRISGMQFDPPRVVVKKGATVTWTQAEQMPHTVTASDGSFTSETLSNGQTFSMTFDEAGTVKYYCSLHPGMRGEVVVVE